MTAGRARSFAFTRDMERVVLEQRLGFVATVCPEGTPNLAPKGTTTIWDDDHHLVFADIASPRTIRNLQFNPAVEINVVDPFSRKAIASRELPPFMATMTSISGRLPCLPGEATRRRPSALRRLRSSPSNVPPRSFRPRMTAEQRRCRSGTDGFSTSVTSIVPISPRQKDRREHPRVGRREGDNMRQHRRT